MSDKDAGTDGVHISRNQLTISSVIVGAVIVFFVYNFFHTGQPTTQQQAPGASQEIATTSTSEAQAEPQSQKPIISDASGNLLPAFIAAVEPNVVSVNCYSADGTLESSGSGLSYLYTQGQSKQNLIYTNYHVYNGAVIGGLAPTCYAVFPEPPNFYYNQNYGDYQITLTYWHYNPNTYEDAALFTLGAPVASSVVPNHIPVIQDTYSSFGITKNQCPDNNASVGDGITIFGYPNSGNLLGISETVTTGIVSGILPGPIYKTNAAIDHGNSGGIAILNKNGCTLGIPTLGASGVTSGIGYIQSYPLAEAAAN